MVQGMGCDVVKHWLLVFCLGRYDQDFQVRFGDLQSTCTGPLMSTGDKALVGIVSYYCVLCGLCWGQCIGLMPKANEWQQLEQGTFP